MKKLGTMLTEGELNEYMKGILESQEIDEGLKDWFSKTVNFLKSKLAKVGKWFVTVWDDKVAPVVNPVLISQYIKSLKQKGTFMIADSQVSRIAGSPNKLDDVLKSYKGATREMLLGYLKSPAAKRAAMNTIPESLGDDEPLTVMEAIEQLIVEENDMLNEAITMNNADRQMYNVVGPKKLATIIKAAMFDPINNGNLLIWGAPGVGKTEIVKEVATQAGKNDKAFIEFQLTTKRRDDFSLPTYEHDEHGNVTRAKQVPLSVLPLYLPTGDPVKDAEADAALGKGVLFFDEISRTDKGVLDVMLKITDSSRSLEGWKLGSGWTIIAASNRLEDDMDQTELGAALAGRFQQINYSATFDGWKKWAETKDYIHPFILSWLDNEENQKYWHKTDLNNGKENGEDDGTGSTLSCTPRNWARACKSIYGLHKMISEDNANTGGSWSMSDLDDDMIEMYIAANLGQEVASLFMEFYKLMAQYNMEDLKLCWTNGKKCPLPEKRNGRMRLDVLYAILDWQLKTHPKEPTGKEFEQYCIYLSRLSDPSAASKCLTLFPVLYAENKEHEKTYWHSHVSDTEINAKYRDKYKQDYLKGFEILDEAYPELSSDDLHSEFA